VQHQRGVAKTSAAVNRAYSAPAGAGRGLLWDRDPQGAATNRFRVKPRVNVGGKKLVRANSDVHRLVSGTDFERLDLLPADFTYRRMDLALDATNKPTRSLARVLAPLSDECDYIFLDPLVSESIFETADVLLVPIIPASLSSRTFRQLHDVVAAEAATLRVMAFFSMVDRRKRLHGDVIASLAPDHGELVRAAIPSASDVEPMGERRTVLDGFAAGGRAAEAHRVRWHELNERSAAEVA
jgi:cellulose biosynthesis protein BcsQ